MTDFSDWLSEQIDDRGWKPNDLSTRAGLGAGVLSRILNRERKPNPETLSAIARALKVSPEIVFRATSLTRLSHVGEGGSFP